MPYMDKTVTTRVPPDLWKRVKREAKLHKLKMYHIFEEALILWMANRDRPRKRDAA
jgi:hypothetical protein